MTIGYIHSIESFGTLDGPGIRFVLFMQGCPLRCIYCHNRDTRDISLGKKMTVQEIICELKKYLEYIKLSGGGITISGGEPTLQADFVSEVFKEAKKLNIHTALDTSGYADISKVEELLKFTDLVLLDIKHAIKDKHKQITGVKRDKIEAFSRHVSKIGIPIWIRYVLVPGYTDSEEDLIAASKFIKKLKTVEKIEVLPYTAMGRTKWEKMGEKYPLENVEPPTVSSIKKAELILSNHVFAFHN